jgi:uncharacterized membrane protein YeaQ/YmgE (transglycosylase-associated protein family)
VVCDAVVTRPFASLSSPPLVACDITVGKTIPQQQQEVPVGILAWIIVGLIGGIVAKLIVPGDDPGGGGILGIVVTILLGIAGALLGGFLAVAMGISNGVDDFDIGTILLSIVGAVIILVAYNALVGRRGLRV